MASRRAARKRQTRLNFTPADTSSPQRSEAFVRIDESSTPSKRRKTSSGDLSRHLSRHPKSSTANSEGRVKVVIPSPRRKSNALPTPAPSSQLEPGRNVRDEEQSKGEGEDEELVDEDDEIIPTSSRRSRGHKAVEPQQSKNTNGAHPERPKAHVIRLSSDNGSDSDSDITIVTPKKTPQPELMTPSSRSVNGKTFILGARSGTAAIADRRGSQNIPRRGKRAQRYDSTSSSESEPTPAKRSQRRSARALSEGDEASDHSINHSTNRSINRTPIAAPRRRKTGSPDPEASKSPDIESELENDLADLRSSDVETRETRTRGRPQTSERNKRLDRLQELKRRRSGIVELSSGSEDNQASASGASDHDSEVSEVEIPQTNNYTEDMDQYEEDFVHDDDDDTLGVDLSMSGVPLELTQFARLKPFEYFKFEVEWMVHNKLDPAFERHDEIYRVSHQKLDDEFIGHAGSTYKSSVWTQDFIDALMGRPEFSVQQVPTMFEEKCNACNRSGHPPKFRVTISGKKYDKNSLEPISNGQSDHESDDDEDESSQTDAHEDQVFNLGRHCYANAEIAHTLYHWRFHLNDLILKWLDGEGHLRPDKIVKRENWSRKKKEKLANKIVDGMVEEGHMKRLHRSFKDSLEAARTAKPERFYNDSGL